MRRSKDLGLSLGFAAVRYNSVLPDPTVLHGSALPLQKMSVTSSVPLAQGASQCYPDYLSKRECPTEPDTNEDLACIDTWKGAKPKFGRAVKIATVL
jgi:hypothetical protein